MWAQTILTFELDRQALGSLYATFFMFEIEESNHLLFESVEYCFFCAE